MTLDDYTAYLERYVKKNALRPRISFETTLLAIDRADAGYVVKLRDEAGQFAIEVDAVAICAGSRLR